MTAFHPLHTAFRALRRHPGSALVSVAVLALGIGAATALFSLYSAIVLRPLAAPNAGQIEALTLESPKDAGWQRGLGLQEWQELHRMGGPVAGLLLEEPLVVRLEAGTEVASAQALVTSPDYFRQLGLGLKLGPGYEEGQPGVVLGEALWRRAFAGHSSLEGCRVQVNGASLPVLGVAPASWRGFSSTRDNALWLPVEAVARWSAESHQSYVKRSGDDLRTFVRLAPGASAAQAQAALQTRVQGWVIEAFKGAPKVVVTGMGQARQRAWERFMPKQALVWWALGLLLALACLNVAQLQAARAYDRRREEATRMALGARPGQVLAAAGGELLVLVLTGAALALPVAWGVARLLAGLSPADMNTFEIALRLDGRVLGFALGLLLLMGLVMMAASSWRLRHLDPARDLKDGTGGFARMTHLHRGLLGLQVALALALLWSATSVLGGLRRTLARPLGFDPKGVTALTLGLPAGVSKAERLAKLERLQERVSALPGVQSAALAGTSPLDPLSLRMILLGEDNSEVAFEANIVGPGYFRTLGIPVLEGREFDSSERPYAADFTPPSVAILSRSQAKAYWLEGGPSVGRRIAGNAHQVIGVVEDHAQTDLQIQPRGFVPFAHVGFNWQCLIVRSTLPPAQLLPLLDRAVFEMDPRWPVNRAEVLTEKLLRQQQPARMAASLLGGLGILAGILAFSGIFGLQSHLTARRVREAGLRTALGASSLSVAATFTRAVVLPALVGLAGGTLLVLIERRLLERLMDGLGEVSWPSLAAAAATLLATALAAAWIPAFRAARVHPAQALRSE